MTFNVAMELYIELGEHLFLYSGTMDVANVFFCQYFPWGFQIRTDAVAYQTIAFLINDVILHVSKSTCIFCSQLLR